MNEFDFIRHYLQRQQADAELILGIGDDAAIIRPRAGFDLHVSSDMLLAGRHFFVDVAPADLAHKILAVNLSDMAAMGATPRWALLSVALPYLDAAWLTAFCDSLFTLARRFGVTLVGGDTTRGDWVFNVTIMGETPQNQGLRRSGAQPGDDIWVSGQLGLAAAALNVHRQTVVLPEAVRLMCDQKLLRPEPRVALGQRLLTLAHAAQDVSDGLAQDIGHILTASHVGACIDVDRLPTAPALRQWAAASPERQQDLRQWMLAGGDDYELVFTAPVAARSQISHIAAITATELTRIGSITASAALELQDSDGNGIILAQQGFNHFDK